MRTTKNTVLITGGSAGIGFATAKQLTELGNHVIITGRNKANLQQAASQLDNVTAIACDVTSEADVNALFTRLEADFPQLNMVINNAGRAVIYKLGTGADTYSHAKDEMETNFFAILRLNDKLLPLLSKQPEAAIVNVSSVLALVPAGIATYSASKAALHSYTQALRHALSATTVKVFELMPPLVNTEFSKEIGGANGVAPEYVANDLIEAFTADKYEIHVGDTAYIYDLFRKDPEQAFNTMNAARAEA